MALPVLACGVYTKTADDFVMELLLLPISPRFILDIYFMVAIIPIIIGESFILKVQQLVSWKKAILIVTTGNLFNVILTLLMILIIINFIDLVLVNNEAYSLSLSLISVAVGITLSSMYLSFAHQSKLFQKIGKKRSIFLTYLLFTVFSLFPMFAVNLFDTVNRLEKTPTLLKVQHCPYSLWFFTSSWAFGIPLLFLGLGMIQSWIFYLWWLPFFCAFFIISGMIVLMLAGPVITCQFDKIKKRII